MECFVPIRRSLWDTGRALIIIVYQYIHARTPELTLNYRFHKSGRSQTTFLGALSVPNIYFELLLCAICFIRRASHVVLIKILLVVRDRNPIYINKGINSLQGHRWSFRNNQIQEYKILIRPSSFLISFLCFFLHNVAILIRPEVWLQATLSLNHYSLETKEEVSFLNPNFINNNLKIPRRDLRLNQTSASCPSPLQSLWLVE